MMSPEEKEIRRFFDDAAGVKLELDDRGALWDPDSNWGFDPAELARRLRELEPAVVDGNREPGTSTEPETDRKAALPSGLLVPSHALFAAEASLADRVAETLFEWGPNPLPEGRKNQMAIWRRNWKDVATRLVWC